MKTRILFALLLFLIIVACGGKETPEDLGQARAPKAALWIDVRTEAEFETAHLPGALNVPLDLIAERIAEVEPDRGRAIKLYCGSGRRSGIAKDMLEQLGYTDVTNEGGYAALKNKQ